MTAYILKEEFRQLSDITVTDLSDDIVNKMLSRGAKQLQEECFILRRREQVGKTLIGEQTRYYLSHQYLADTNLNGTIDKDDLIVEEINADGSVVTNITSQVDSINLLDGYFVLKSGYPANGTNVFVTYRWTRYPITDSGVLDEYKELNLCISMEYILRLQMTRAFKRGVTSQSTSGFSISRDFNTFKDLMKDYIERKNELFNKHKPRRVVSWKGNNGYTQYPNNVGQPAKRDNLGNSDNITNNFYYNRMSR